MGMSDIAQAVALFLLQETQPEAAQDSTVTNVKIVAGVLALILVAVIILRRKKKKKAEEEF